MWSRRLAVASVPLLVCLAACSAKTRDLGPAPGVLITDAAAPEPAACEGRRCSRDLHSVLDNCTGAVIEACSSDTGCANGACVPACSSAATAQGSIGCSFAAVPPDVPADKAPGCFAAIVSNTWTTPVHVTAELAGAPLDVSKSVYRVSSGPDGAPVYESLSGVIPVGEAGVVFLAQGDDPTGSATACPPGVTEAYHGVIVNEHRTSIYDTFRVSTDRPVAAYSIFPYGGAKSYMPTATLLLPTTSWGTNYLLVDGWNNKLIDDRSFVQIVAREDDTEVLIRPRVDIASSSSTSPVQFTPAGEVSRTLLQRGQVLELSQRESLVGSALEASRPVAVFGGNPCTYLPAQWAACDALQQQIPPLSHWSSRYSAVPYRTRRTALDGLPISENVHHRIVSAQDGTTLRYEPTRPVGAPLTMQGGEAATFRADYPFIVRSQDNEHPIYVAVFMSGTVNPSPYNDGEPGYNVNGEGDPDFVNLIPDEQFLDHYVFFIDHTYANTSVTLVRRNDGTGFQDVDVDCVGTVGDWRPLGTDGRIEYTWLVLTKDGKGTSAGGKICQYGRHEASSAGAFELYVWGTDKFASYGYPAGAGSRPATKVRVEVN